MAREPCRHGDHRVGAQLITAQDLAGPGGCHLGAALLALGLPLPVAASLGLHCLGRLQIDLNPVDRGHQLASSMASSCSSSTVPSSSPGLSSSTSSPLDSASAAVSWGA